VAKYASIGSRPKTVLVDVDGVIFRQIGRWPDIDLINPKKDLLPGVREKFLEWEMKGYRIILMTGRADNYKSLTEEQLEKAGIPYHLLVMSAGMGQRVLINNLKPKEPHVPTAVAVNLEVDRGFEDMDDI
jgi:hypothetical protein